MILSTFESSSSTIRQTHESVHIVMADANHDPAAAP